MKRLKVNDPVIVIAGNDKGVEGSVVSIDKDRVVVKGVCKRKKHQKSRGDNTPGKMVEFNAPINISNVMYCHKGEAVKLRTRIREDKKEIYFKTKENEEKVIRTI
ncbi:MAG: 50S ribosomal protein L24 [Chlamydiae bacterium RIFCSPHIGHO2_12_FULL_49_11]|nr:MAG: 50S ribosomal protein L24 [Chlamydiae bacterium RIFCSPHIGHO2_12_FULL_49_11]